MNRRAWILSAVAALVVVATGALVAMPRAERAAFPVTRGVPTPAPGPSAPPRMPPEELYAAFRSAGTAASFHEAVRISLDQAGDVVLPTGRLVAVDAFIIDGVPFTTTLPAGRYPVSVLRVDFASGDRRIAAALVRGVADEPVRWELAVVPGQDPTRLGPDEIFGYGVDSGTGSFTSPEAIGRLRDLPTYDAYSKAITAGMFPAQDQFVLTVAVDVDRASGANVVAFASGFGDGQYPSFIGFDSDGRAAAVVTDFGILDAAGS